MKRVCHHYRNNEGSTLVTAAVGVAVLAGMAAGIMIIGDASTREQESDIRHSRSFYLAQSGISEALSQATLNNAQNQAVAGDVGTYTDPHKSGGGKYWASIVDNEDGTFTLTSTGDANGTRRALQVIARRRAGGAFANALYAGNSSGDPNYELDFGGTGGQADEINGNIYSGNDIKLSGDATLNGKAFAAGSIDGVGGEEGASQPFLDLEALDFPNNHDVDVLGEFMGGTAKYKYDDSGGNAYQLPESNPAHIFRMNPSDRRTEYQSTKKKDFFLEDPYEARRASKTGGMSIGTTKITLTGAKDKPGIDGSGKVYFIDGNLWIHNKRTKSFIFYDEDGSQINVTFVVRGNIYFSDNMFYQDAGQNGVAFLAMKDPNLKTWETGNVYFGDPVFGTLDNMSGFMYAENNFHDINLDSSGTGKVTVNGNMACGNQFVVNRDVGTAHTKLVVNHDARQVNGQLELPGIPLLGQDGTFEPIAWREVGVPATGSSSTGGQGMHK